MKCSLGIFTYLAAFLFQLVQCLIPFITGGSYAKYSQYTHSAYLLNFCQEKFTCGGSILNQNIVLTAAHCLRLCKEAKEKYSFFVKYGHQNITKMNSTRMKDFVIHEKYDAKNISNDIGIIMTVDKIPLSVVKRVVLMRSPPKEQEAFVAGWGIDENTKRQSSLKHTTAWIQNGEVCKRMGQLPNGTFCAGPITGIGAADRGDSGSALVVKNFIQIGIVSFKVASTSLVAYTNVSYYLDWIQEKAEELFCLDAQNTKAYTHIRD